MRLIYLPLNVPGSEQVGTTNAFKSIFGNDNVLVFDYLAEKRAAGSRSSNQFINKTLYEAAKEFRPDVIHGQYQDTMVIDPETLARIREELKGVILTHWTGDLRERVNPYLLDIAKVCHLTLLSNRKQFGEYHSAGAKRVEYWQVGFEGPFQPVVDLPFKTPSIVFCGRYYRGLFPASEERLEMVRCLQTEFGERFGVVGSGYPEDVRVIGQTYLRQQPSIYSKTQVIVTQNHFNDVESYYSDRMLEALGSGKPSVVRRVPRLEDEFKEGVHFLGWSDFGELVGCVRTFLADDELASRFGRRARNETILSHTYFSRVHQLVGWIEELRDAKNPS